MRREKYAATKAMQIILLTGAQSKNVLIRKKSVARAEKDWHTCGFFFCFFLFYRTSAPTADRRYSKQTLFVIDVLKYLLVWFLIVL